MIDGSFLQEIINNSNKISKLKFEEISKILKEAKNIFKDENLLLKLETRKTDDEVYVIGDVHGNLPSLMKLIDIIKENKPKFVISLGDIVDRGQYQLECLIVVLALKILRPKSFYILRGNHETLEMNQAYGFFREFTQKFTDYKKFYEILELYNLLPICAIINSTILCLHGGIPEDIEILKKLKDLKPEDVNEFVLKSLNQSIFQIMWNDPKEQGLKRFKESYRGAGIKFFGEEVFDKFMKTNNLTYLIRAHECFPEGYRWFFNEKLLSIFSAANYRGPYLPNPASYAIIKSNKVIPKTIEL